MATAVCAYCLAIFEIEVDDGMPPAINEIYCHVSCYRYDHVLRTVFSDTNIKRGKVHTDLQEWLEEQGEDN